MGNFLQRALCSNCPQTTSSLQGFRVLFSYLVVAGHAAIFSPLLLRDPLQPPTPVSFLPAFAVTWTYVVQLGAWASVDIFFFLSAFCMLSTIAKSTRNVTGKLEGKISGAVLLRYIIARWLRLAPLYIFFCLVGWWRGIESCVRASELLFIGSWEQRWGSLSFFEDACIGVGWSVGADFQMHMILAAILWMGGWRGAWRGMWAMLVGCMGLRAWKWRSLGGVGFRPLVGWEFYEERVSGLSIGVLDWARSEAIRDNRDRFLNYSPLYVVVWYRVGVFCIGGLTWIMMKEKRSIVGLVRRNGGIAIAFVVGTWVVFGIYATRLFSDGGAGLTDTVLESVARVVVGCGMGIQVMLSCDVGGHNMEGEWVRDGLQWVFGNRIMRALSRSCYAVYLGHMFAGWGLQAVIHDGGRSYWDIVVGGIWWYLGTVVLCVPVCLMEEVGLAMRHSILVGLFGKKEVIEGKKMER